jgi:phosphoglycolate phosphatase
MLHACQLIDTDPRHCLYVGDAERDIQAGRAVGMKTVLVNWGYIADSDDTASWQADITINQPDELLAHL